MRQCAGRRSSQRSPARPSCSSSRCRSACYRDLPRGVREPRALVESRHRGNIQNLAAVPAIVYGISTWPSPSWHRRRPCRPCRRTHPHLGCPPHRRRVVSGGDPHRSRLDSSGAFALGDEVAGGCAGLPARSPGRNWVDSRALACGGRDRSADHGRRDHVCRRLQPDPARPVYGTLRCRSTTGRKSPTPTSRRWPRRRRDRLARHRAQHERGGYLPSRIAIAGSGEVNDADGNSTNRQ